jgi:RNA polymerase sigma-70 factor (ECF subfamily)
MDRPPGQLMGQGGQMPGQATLPGNPLLTEQALAEVHAQCHAWAVDCCRGRREEAMEVLQTAYVHVLEGRARFDGRSSLRTWMFAVVRNLARSRWRRQLLGRRIELPLEPADWAEVADPAPPVADGIESAATSTRLLAAFEALPMRQREVLALVFSHGHSIEQAAAVLAIGVGTARTHYERGKQSLRRRMGLAPGAGEREP